MRTLLALALCSAIACTSTPQPSSPARGSAPRAAPVATPGAMAEAEVPAELRPAVDRGNKAIQSLGRQLRERLMAELQAGGPQQAIGVCRDQAQQLTAQVAQAHRLELGRTSLWLRNPDNAAPAWVAPYLKEVWGRPAADVDARVFDLQSHVGVVRPIAMGSACVSCHGPAEGIDAQVKALLAEAYPDDQATGFEPGQLRGLFWARVPRSDVPRLPASIPARPIY